MPVAPPARACVAPESRRIKTLETTVSKLAIALDIAIAALDKTGGGHAARRKLLEAFLRKQLARAKVARASTPAELRAFKLEVEQAPDKLSKGSASSISQALRPPKTGHSAAQLCGEAARVGWVRSGEVVPAKVLAEAWGLTPQALGPAEKRGELFSVVLKRHRYYPREFLTLNREDVGAVCMRLLPLDEAEKMIFWKRPHGALGGATVAQLLSSREVASQLVRVTQLARSWSAQARAGTAAQA